MEAGFIIVQKITKALCREIIGRSGDCLWVAEFDYPTQSEATVRRFIDSVKIGGVQ